MVKNPPSNAGNEGLIPGQGTKIPSAMGQLTTEPSHSGACAPQLEKSAPQLEKSPCATTKSPHAAMKIPCAATKTQCSQINK